MKKIAVIFGGKSTEHDISILTAHTSIINVLLANPEFDVWPIYIAKNGTWYSDKVMNNLDFFKEKNIDARLTKFKPIMLSISNGLSITWSGLMTKTVNIDVAFPSMHGTFGEDGTLMGLLRLANIPFVGCDLESSVIAMDKVLSKQATEPLGIPSVPYIWFTRDDWLNEKDNIAFGIEQKLSWPIFVKPVHLGSSIAISKVNSRLELENAIEVALHYDDKIIVEQGISNLIEVTLPIMGNEDLILGSIEQPLSTFFDFEAKYINQGKGGSSGLNNQYSNIPAKISKKLSEQVEYLGKKSYKAIGASGISRIDFLIDKDTNKVFMNEINTLPGSLYSHNWQTKGISGMELVTKLISLAEERFIQNKTTYFFKSDVLQNNFGGKK